MVLRIESVEGRVVTREPIPIPEYGTEPIEDTFFDAGVQLLELPPASGECHAAESGLLVPRPARVEPQRSS